MKKIPAYLNKNHARNEYFARTCSTRLLLKQRTNTFSVLHNRNFSAEKYLFHGVVIKRETKFPHYFFSVNVSRQ